MLKMTKLQIDVITKGNYGFSLKGSKALDLLMDSNTPPVDLLVRESIQNSADATLSDKPYSKIYFDLKQFNNDDLAKRMEMIEAKLIDRFGSKTYDCLTIKDTNTCGLLGKPDDDVGPNNNLYKLVYSFLESGKEGDAGGSWGIGKSVYYRFGIGLVFYYSRTRENGVYIQKLCGAIIENEESQDALLQFDEESTGVAFFGKTGIGKNNTKRTIPIYDEEEIFDFLNVFKIQPLVNDQTGTIIIIPFFNKEECATNFINDGYKPWENDFFASLKISIQRWYFARLSNQKYTELQNKPYIKVFVNGQEVTCNPFFAQLQKLYSKMVDKADLVEIKTTQGFDEHLGYFVFKKFSFEELGVGTPPNNLQNPYVLLDIENKGGNDKNSSIIFYVRKPGMVITYDDASFINLRTEQNECIVGVFVLNDDSRYKGEKLGLYFKDCEAANHKKWEDINKSKIIKEIIALKTKPFKKIRNEINRILSETFSTEEEEVGITVNTALQRKLGELFLPPEDFGKDQEPTIKKGSSEEPKLRNIKEKRIETFYEGFVNGKLSYTFKVFLKPGEYYICIPCVDTTAKKYTFKDWDKLDFAFPCFLEKITIKEYMLNKIPFNLPASLLLNSGKNSSLEKKLGPNKTIFKLSCKMADNSKKCQSFMLQNLGNDELRMSINILITPNDDTFSFSFTNKIAKIGGDNNAK